MEPSPQDITDAIKDTTGETELTVREALVVMEEVLKEFTEENPDFTTGEVALAYALTFDVGTLAWAVAVLLRDRVEFDG